MMSKPVLSVCMPLHKTNKESNKSLGCGMDLARCGLVEFIISDDGKKEEREEIHDYLWGNIHYEHIGTGGGHFANWRNAISKARGEYVMLLSDDDLLYPLPGFDLMKIPKDGIGFRPQTSYFVKGRGLYNTLGYSIEGNTTLERIIDYQKKCMYGNTTLFSAYKRELIQDQTELLYEHHPINGGYSDWVFVMGLLSCGNLPAYDGLLYIYDNSNWHEGLPKEQIKANAIKTFVDAGLPAKAYEILHILTALDFFILVSRHNSPICSKEKEETAVWGLNAYLQFFLERDLEPLLEDPKLSVNERLAFYGLLNNTSTIKDIIKNLLLIIDSYLPGYEEKYVNYAKAALSTDTFYFFFG